ncbi:YkyA family protein [Bacillus sp. DTU_2020_1000418_1_SI_GHA_SEK_038]|uniref:YkyA family protein n=1 Tax=Bacillus sp. DTU_2020_1000418_1_SI_GHA_SEK_038 TaxID=3077585 RepID=UPI0028E252B6|nr:YkyA family protein [Bacillus sp. DTU_2020_1000418_1_SI_GHA_SEK_038]WNS77009.1 YkyA family protein [Bacillus sp. DTU_2020_1000418_1_SI_GHA_SEK_038]
MSVPIKSCLLIICISAVMIISGCLSTSSPVEKIYDVLERVVASEEVFEKQQDPLVELEKKEKEIYDKIISLGMKEIEEVSILSNEAANIVDQRQEHMVKEKESIKASEKEFKSLESLIEEIDEPKLKGLSQDLFDCMMERYATHEEIFQHYSKAVQLDKDLYAMFKEESLQLIQLEDQINKINEAYGNIINANKKFNDKTKQYNELKLSFYKESGLDVKMKD